MLSQHGRLAGSPSTSNSPQFKSSRQTALYQRPKGLPSPQQAKPRDVTVAGSSAVDVVTTASDLILQSAAQNTLPSHAQHVAHFIHTLTNAIDSGSIYHHSSLTAAHGLDSAATSADMSSLVQQMSHGLAQETVTHAPHLTATLPTDALGLDPEVILAAQQGMSDLANSSAAWSTAAASAALLLTDQQGPAFQALAALAAERLSVLQAIDPESFSTMRLSLDTLFSSLSDLLDHEMGLEAGQWTNALVLGVQQLVSATRMTEPGGAYSVDAMVEAQRAVQEAAKASPTGLPGLMTLTMGIIAMIVACIPKAAPPLDRQSATEDEVPLRYNPAELSAYWSCRPIMVMKRSTEVVSKLVGFLVVIIADAKTGQWEKRMPQRAMEIRKIVESLGAACVKIAQAASTRVDMLPQVYLDEFSRLQDNVQTFSTVATGSPSLTWGHFHLSLGMPLHLQIAQAASTRVDMLPQVYLDEFSRLQDNVQTFSTVEARFVLEEGLGRSVDTVFEWMSEEPLAAASLGQVYRGKLRPEYGSNEVAVKVQRPGVLQSAALDVFIMRRAAVLFSKLPGMSDQWANVLDDWALRFFQEMDYQLEAHNTMTFKTQMASLQGIVVPTIHPEFTSRKVIVSDWIEGDKLGDSKASDVQALCSTLLNCYLIQLLETGLLHADPHPGNLMRTRDGKLVILDFGLMTEVTESQRIGLVEFIAHLTMEDWDGLTQDLVTLDFMPADMPEEARAQIKPVMNEVFSKVVSGGGLGKTGLNFSAIGMQLSHISMNYQMCVPGYFTNVLRAFSVIEGTALKVDPNYSIVQQCSPYLSRRLLTDNNPRMRAALRQLLYGDGKRLDVARLQRLISSFTSFTTSGAPGSTGSAAAGPTFSSAFEERVKGAASDYQDEGPVLNETMKEALKVVFAKDGSYAQELIVEELVAAMDAMSRQGLSEALHLVMGSATAVAALRSVEALGPLRAMLLPIPFPMEMLHSMEPAVTLTKDDRQALSTLRAVLDLIQPSGTSLLAGIPNVAYAGSRAVRAAGEVMPMLPELLPGLQVTVELFVKQLIRRMALRLAEDLEPSKSAASSPAAATQPPPPL